VGMAIHKSGENYTTGGDDFPGADSLTEVLQPARQPYLADLAIDNQDRPLLYHAEIAQVCSAPRTRRAPQG